MHSCEVDQCDHYKNKHRASSNSTQDRCIYPYIFLQGKVKYDEHVIKGFDNTFEAFAGLFRGDNIGKVVVEV